MNRPPLPAGESSNYGTDPLAMEDHNRRTSHLKTYTAGEDDSRLAAAAKELGLEKSRQPRPQVRKTTKSSRKRHQLVLSILLDTGTEDAYMKSIISAHEESQDRQAWSPLPSSVSDRMADLEQGDEDEEVTGGTLTAATLGIIKGMVGPAILYLPHGFATAGYLVALPVLVVTTVFFLYSSNCLLECWRYEQEASEEIVNLLHGATPRKRTVLSYPELAYRALGAHGEGIVKTGIALMQSGVCLTYFIFVSQNLHTFANNAFGLTVSASHLLLVMIVIQVPLSWLRDIRKLTLTNLFANTLILYGLTTCLGYALAESFQGEATTIANIADHLQSLTPYKNTWYLFIGTCVVLFEGSITLLIPLQEAVHGVERRKQFGSVYNTVILAVVAFYTIFGLVCWTGFGPQVQTVLTTSLPIGSQANTVQLAYSIAVIFTFPLQNFPALEITVRSIKAAMYSRNCSVRLHRNVLSSLLILLLAAIAVCTMESLDKVVSLMGSLLGCPLSFVFPPLIHSYLVPNISTQRLWGNRLVIAFGLLAMIGASTVTLHTWVSR
ncbi:hypothetical protein MPSEU_000732200 [Mayamaea pseudoterrestris]|nr:hypothetical protein MPSEU_000732200 [Mayamaea pseudoterrestris]